MFGVFPFGAAPFGATAKPIASSVGFNNSVISFEAKAEFIVLKNDPLDQILGSGNLKIAFAAVIKPWRLVKG
jgi:hypothetical protein